MIIQARTGSTCPGVCCSTSQHAEDWFALARITPHDTSIPTDRAQHPDNRPQTLTHAGHELVCLVPAKDLPLPFIEAPTCILKFLCSVDTGILPPRFPRWAYCFVLELVTSSSSNAYVGRPSDTFSLTADSTPSQHIIAQHALCSVRPICGFTAWFQAPYQACLGVQSL